MSCTRPLRLLALAGLCTLVLSVPAAAQFASVPKPPAPTPYDVRFGRDTAQTLSPTAQDSIRAAARAQLRAWVDSAAGAMDIEINVPDSLAFPEDSAALDSIARKMGPEGARTDSVRRDSVTRDSARRDSVRRDSVRRATPPDGMALSLGSAVRAAAPYDSRQFPTRTPRRGYDAVLLQLGSTRVHFR